MHKVERVNERDRIAWCSECGFTKVTPRYKNGAQTGWRCVESKRQSNRAYDWQRNAERGGYAALPLDPHEKARRLEEQGGKCAVCLEELTLKSARLDHCHTSGRVRGVLCNQCNRTLGLYKDDQDTFERFVDYLA